MIKKIKVKKTKINLPRSVHRLFPDVKHAYDASKSVEVSVETKDCKDAKKLDPSQCALARAAKRELKADAVIIGMTSSYIIKGDTALRFATPMSVQKEIVSFDRHGDFAPGDYTLIPKSPTSKLGHKYESRGNRGGNHKSKRKMHRSARVRILPAGGD